LFFSFFLEVKQHAFRSLPIARLCQNHRHWTRETHSANFVLLGGGYNSTKHIKKNMTHKNPAVLFVAVCVAASLLSIAAAHDDHHAYNNPPPPPPSSHPTHPSCDSSNDESESGLRRSGAESSQSMTVIVPSAVGGAVLVVTAAIALLVYKLRRGNHNNNVTTVRPAIGGSAAVIAVNPCAHHPHYDPEGFKGSDNILPGIVVDQRDPVTFMDEASLKVAHVGTVVQ
jgi:hypothetical protein